MSKLVEPMKTYQVPAEIVTDLRAAVKAWRSASSKLESFLSTLTDPKRKAELSRVIRALNAQALQLEQIVIASD